MLPTLNSFLSVRNYRNGWLCHVLAFADTYLKSCTFTNLLYLFYFILLITWPNFLGYNIAMIINTATIVSIKPWQCLESSCYTPNPHLVTIHLLLLSEETSNRGHLNYHLKLVFILYNVMVTVIFSQYILMSLYLKSNQL